MDYFPKKDWITLDQNNEMRIKCEKVNFPLNEIDLVNIKKMISYIDESYLGNAKKFNIRPGIGIAANQIGYKKRMFYIHLDDENKIEHKYFLINPNLLSVSAKKAYILAGEGCLSVPVDKKGYVIRNSKIKIEGYDFFQKKNITIEAKGILSMCLQHEYDHLEGKLYYDRINPIKPMFVDEDWEKIN
ncbi:peptide deformylase [Mycoplasmoides alvi]|uniref:peptide deformylase n=1 Tax=Mycoplasmoides alvi TaxID=78580 RepID=UPI00051C8BBD|nr:peptide deformylase [Mycoplasmoides alvi]